MEKKYRCSACDLEVESLPKFKKGECPAEAQHYFEEISKAEEEA